LRSILRQSHGTKEPPNIVVTEASPAVQSIPQEIIATIGIHLSAYDFLEELENRSL
jgi:hypothetical protein